MSKNLVLLSLLAGAVRAEPALELEDAMAALQQAARPPEPSALSRSVYARILAARAENELDQIDASAVSQDEYRKALPQINEGTRWLDVALVGPKPAFPSLELVARDSTREKTVVGPRESERRRVKAYRGDPATGRVLGVEEREYGTERFSQTDQAGRDEYVATLPWILNAFGVSSVQDLIGMTDRAVPRHPGWPASMLAASWSKDGEKGTVDVDFKGDYGRYREGVIRRVKTLDEVVIVWKQEFSSVVEQGGRKIETTGWRQRTFALDPKGALTFVAGDSFSLRSASARAATAAEQREYRAILARYVP